MSGDVEMVAEWALRGKDPSDREYRLLACSEAQLSEENFARQLQRYETGTLSMLPEVTVSWCSDKMSNNYLGIALHRRPAEAKFDAAGREFMETSLFCLDYGELARRTVSYTSMYLGVRDCLLPPEENGWPTTRTGRRIIARMPTGDFSGAPRPLAIAVAGSMLADKTVCVLGADRVSLDERLRFLDEVAAALPYGMRSRLSASTLTSSTYKTHAIRLFFANSPRGDQDVILTWGGDVSTPIGRGSLGKYIDRYIEWLYKDPSAGIHRLAKITRQMGFVQTDVVSVIRELELDDPSPFPPLSPQPPPITVEELLSECGRRLNAKPPESIGTLLEPLSACVSYNPSAESRHRYQEIVRQHRMLRENPPILDREMLPQFYNLILRVVFGAPITYEIYCAVEDSVEDQDSGELHQSLAKAVYGLRSPDLRTQLIVLHAIGAGFLNDGLADRGFSAEFLVQMVLDEETQKHHRNLIYTIVIDDLERRRTGYKPGELQKIFAARGYLTAPLYEFYDQDPGEQLRQLKRIFTLCFGDVLPGQSGAGIIGEPSLVLTPALCGALVQMADRQEMTQIFWDFAFRYIVASFTGEGLTGEAQKDLIRRFDEVRPPGIEKPKFNVKKNSHRRKRAWWLRSKLRIFALASSLVVILGCVGYVVDKYLMG